MSRVNAGYPTAPLTTSSTPDLSIIGGTSFSGGIGTAGGTVVGSLHRRLPQQHHEPANVNSYMQQIARGAIIALAVIYDLLDQEQAD
jgi:inositol transport system permease protein